MKSNNLEFTKDDEKEINAALRLNQLNREKSYQIALEVFLKFKNKYANSPALMGMIGGQYWLLRDYKNCSLYFKAVTNLNPKSETASSMLFISLYKQKLVSEAYDEMERFLSRKEFSKPLKHYPITLKEFYEQIDENTSERAREVITKYYKIFIKE